MWRPKRGICRCHSKERWLVNKAGYCQQGNQERKNKEAKEDASRINKRRIGIETGEFIRRTDLKRYKLTGLPKTWPKSSYVKIKKQASIKKGKPAKRFREPTGEAKIFAEEFEKALQEAAPECPKCRVCSDPLGYTPRVIFFSHVLGKGSYQVFRLWKLNIWICCERCHKQWHETGRSDLPSYFRAKIALESLLKRFYYFTRSIVNYDYERLPTSIEEVERIVDGVSERDLEEDD